MDRADNEETVCVWLSDEQKRTMYNYFVICHYNFCRQYIFMSFKMCNELRYSDVHAKLMSYILISIQQLAQ